MPYCFSRSSIKFQGHIALEIVEFDSNWAFPDCNSSLNSTMAMKCCTKLETAKKRCPIVFQGHPSNFKVTRDKTSPILTQIGRFGLQAGRSSQIPQICLVLIDTLFAGQDRLPTSLTIQLAQIYGKCQDRLDIIAPFVKSQVGGNDCGAFAIANLVEFCMGNFWRDKDSLSSRGDLCQDTLRSHLVTCFERKKFSEFMARASYGRKSCKSYFIDISCSCGLPDEYDNMIACNGCEGWFHQVCAGVNESSLPDSWVCWECVEKGDDVIGRSPRDI